MPIPANEEHQYDVDILVVVSNYQKVRRFLNILLQPLIQAKDLILWRKNKAYSILFLILICTLCLIPELSVAVCLQAVITVMLLGYWFRGDNKGDMSHSVEQNNRKQDLVEFRHILYLVQQFLSVCCEALDKVKNLVSWTEPRVSLLFTLVCVAEGLVLVLFGVRWFLTTLPVCVFCFNTGFFELLCQVLPLKDRDVKTSVAKSTSENSADSDQHADSSQEGASELAHNPTGPLQSSPFSMSPKSKIRRRFIGSCGICGVAFSNLLRRKHRCDSCGDYFCGRCSLKVKKTLLGATSPAAYEDSVRVCIRCSKQLQEQQSEKASSVRENTAPQVTEGT